MDAKSLAAPGAWTARRVLALLGTIFIWFAVAVDAWYLWPTNLGGSTSFVIVSGSSMEPTYLSGDLVIARKMEPSIGDVIVYAPEGFGGAQIVHRIIGGNGEDGWIMQGDNNTFIDPFEPKDAEVRGVVVVHYSSLGQLTALLLSPLVWASVLLLSIVLLVWFSGDDCDDDDEDDDEAGDNDGTEQLSTAPDDAETSQEVANSPPAPVGVGGAVTRTMSVLAVAALLVFGSGVTPAAASSLTVNTVGSAAVISKTRCAAGVWAATVAGTPSAGDYTQVQLSAIPAGCQGLLATVYVHNSAGAVIATGTVTPTGATATVTTSSYSGAAVTAVFIKVQGWPVRTVWTPPTPTNPPAGQCWAMLHSTGQRTTDTTCTPGLSPGGVQYLDQYNGGPGNYRDVGMSLNYSPSSYIVNGVYIGEFHAFTKWRVTVDLTASAISSGINLSGQYYIYAGHNTALAPGETCANPAAVTFEESVQGNDPTGAFTISSSPIAWKGNSSLLCTRW